MALNLRFYLTVILNKNFILSRTAAALTVFFLCAPGLSASDAVISDPDNISTGIKYGKVSDVQLGDYLTSDIFAFGGMVNVRNESRFNQEILPNHNWRGFAFLYFKQTFPFYGSSGTAIFGAEHESAHSTMGLNDGNNSAYEKIYDGSYRNINLNSFMLRLISRSGSTYALTITGDFQFYFNSRNTPELPVNDRLTWSQGVSCGFELQYPASDNVSLFISGFDRYIFQSRKKIRSGIYYDTDSGTEKVEKDYPVINSVNTISIKTGLIFSRIIPERKLSLFFGFMYGNIYGFVDSRERRKQLSAGIEIFH